MESEKLSVTLLTRVKQSGSSTKVNRRCFFRFYAESLVLLGRLSEAQKIHKEVKTRMPSSDPEEVKDDFYLDFFFEQMNPKIHSISPKAVELVSVSPHHFTFSILSDNYFLF